MRMLAPERGSINNQEARPWRAALASITSPRAVNHMLLPLFAPAFKRHLCDIVSSQAQVRWVDTSRRLAFGVASRAIMGSLITETEIDDLYNDYVVYAQGAFQTVRHNICSLHCTLNNLVQPERDTTTYPGTILANHGDHGVMNIASFLKADVM